MHVQMGASIWHTSFRHRHCRRRTTEYRPVPVGCRARRPYPYLPIGRNGPGKWEISGHERLHDQRRAAPYHAARKDYTNDDTHDSYDYTLTFGTSGPVEHCGTVRSRTYLFSPVLPTPLNRVRQED